MKAGRNGCREKIRREGSKSGRNGGRVKLSEGVKQEREQ